MNRSQRRAAGIFSNAQAERRSRQIAVQYSTIPLHCSGPDCDELALVTFASLANPYDFCDSLRTLEWEVGQEEGDMPGTFNFVPFCPSCKVKAVEGSEQDEQDTLLTEGEE